MSTYLELCQEVALESGTVPALGDPSTVAGVSGRLLRITGWTARAWEDIQRLSEHWRWMSAEFSGETISGVEEYDGAAMGITSRFRSWQCRSESGSSMFTSYLTSDGPSDEGLLEFRDWEWMRRNVLIGDWLSNAEKHSKPAYITVTPADKLLLYPVPDAAYTIRGRYRKANQILTVDADTPECPAQFHEAIVWRALTRMAIFDEAFANAQEYDRIYLGILQGLKSDQLPHIELGGPLA